MGNKIGKMYNSTKNVKTLIDEKEELSSEIDYLKQKIEKIEANLKLKNESLETFIKEMNESIRKLEESHKDFI